MIMDEEKPLLADVVCEGLVIGTILNNENSLAEAVGALNESSFTVWKHLALWRIIKSLYSKGNKVDIISVSEALAKDPKAHGLKIDEVLEASNHCVVGGGLHEYIARLQELEQRRRMRSVGIHIQQLSNDELTPINEALVQAREMIDRSLCGNNDGITTLSETKKAMLADMEANIHGRTQKGTPTGFAAIDSKGGLHDTDLVVIAGCTSQGKTSLATAITLNAIRSGRKVAFYSLEMPSVQLTARITAMCSGVSASTILYGKPTAEEQKRIKAALESLSSEHLLFDDSSTSSIDKILASIRRMKMKYGIDGAVVDYLQILNVNMKTANKEQQMADVARRLKNLAKDLHIWVIALSQLNRDRDNPEPSIDRLRDSGQIAEAADVVMLVHRPEYYGKVLLPSAFGSDRSSHNKAIINVAKGRNIGTFKFVCDFYPETTLFADEHGTKNPVISVQQGDGLEDDAPF